MAGIASLHGKTLIASFVLVMFGGSLLWQWQSNADPAATYDVTVEHRSTFGLSISLGKSALSRFVEIGNQGDSPISVTLPETWQRMEVRNVPLQSVSAGEPSLGYVRWTLPAGANVSYRSADDWSMLVIHNPSKIPFKILLATVNVDTKETDRDIILVKDRPVTLR
jgi:hypothetical protein